MNSTPQLVLYGADGKLGSEITRIAFEKNYKTLFLPQVVNNLNEQITSHSIIIDTSIAQGTEYLCEQILTSNNTCRQHIKCLIIGTTGHSQKQTEKIVQVSKIIPVVVCSNFSKGILLFEAMLAATTSYGISVSQLAGELGFDLALWESHHNKKLDAPSGTAKTIAKCANIAPEKIASTRVGHVVGEHSLLISGDSEDLCIKHTAHTRRLFAVGAIDLFERINVAKNLQPQMYDRSFFYMKSK